ncbi:hypothetical protein F511_07513 [Dorcoceras hygrometricum]|uniref:Dystroglycan-like n=1 Tax=Dorcoceras hygrometricum TaxID=472368 RepID=A0A2Z7B541_9LAMI|nr:hypothetical protein F511_07513 [Dorcoceras hygrometricum]
MASSLISNSHHIDFDAVFGMEDNDLVQMFESLIATGLKNFLGCPAVFNEAALTEFFANSSVREYGLVVNTVNGATVEISEEVFAATFELPVEGLTDLSEVPKNLVFDARSLFSVSKEQVSISCLKKAMKIQYRLLHDILAKTIYVKSGSFDSVTRDRFMLMTAITFDVKINWSSLLFGVLREMVTPGSRVLNERTVHRYVVINDKLGGEEVVDAPKVKRTPTNKKGVTKKRPAAGDAEVAPIVKKKRTTKGNPVAAKRLPVEEPVGVSTMSKQPVAEVATGERETVGGLRIASITEATTGDADAAIEQVLAQLDLVIQDSDVERSDRIETWFDRAFEEEFETADQENQDSEDEIDFYVDYQELPVFDETTEATTGDADAAIEQVLAQLDLVIQDSDVERSDRIETWFDRAFEEEFETADQENQDSEDEIDFYVDYQELPVFDETRTVPEVGGSKSFGVDKAGEKAIGSTHSTEEHMSIYDLLMQISEDMMLPSVTAAEITKIWIGESINIHEVQEHDLYYASLPRISIHDKGKEIMEEDEPVRGNPARETMELICGDVGFLVQLRDRVMKDVVEFFHYFSLNKLTDLHSLKALKAKESLMLNWAETDSLEMAVRRRVYILAKYREMLLRKFLESHRKYLVPGQPWTATDSKIIDLLSVAHSKSLEDLIAQQKEQGLPVEQQCTPTFLDTSVGPVVSTNALEEQLYYVESPESPPPIPQRQESSSSSSDSQMNFDSNDIPLDDTTEAQTSLPAATVDFLDDLKSSLSQYVDTAHSDILSRLRTVEQGLHNTLGFQNDYFRNLIQGVTADTASLEIRKAINAVDAKILLLDGRVAAIRSEQLEFQEKISADLLSLSTQIGDLVDYIRGGDAKKGEGSSIRRPLPTPVHQSEGIGDAVRITEPTQADIDNANRAIPERMRNEDSLRAERERDRSRRERRLSRSGAYKRRRGY